MKLEGQVLYELHLGTFTPEGTWNAGRGPSAAPGANWASPTVEVMPVAEFAGSFGWGYDGVDLYAPYHHYGTPDDMRRFVDTGSWPGAWGHPRRRLQPLRPRRLLPSRVLERLHPPRERAHGLGRCAELRRSRIAVRPGVLHRQRRLLDLGVPPRRPPPRRHACDP